MLPERRTTVFVVAEIVKRNVPGPLQWLVVVSSIIHVVPRALKYIHVERQVMKVPSLDIKKKVKKEEREREKDKVGKSFQLVRVFYLKPRQKGMMKMNDEGSNVKMTMEGEDYLF